MQAWSSAVAKSFGMPVQYPLPAHLLVVNGWQHVQEETCNELQIKHKKRVVGMIKVAFVQSFCIDCCNLTEPQRYISASEPFELFNLLGIQCRA